MASNGVEPTITLFSLPKSRSERIAWLLEEMNLPYRFETPMTTGGSLQSFKSKAGAMGRAPTLHDWITNEHGEQEKIVICESGAVAEYLLNQYPKLSASLLPQSPISDRHMIIQYIHQSEATFLAHAVSITVIRRALSNKLADETSSDAITEKAIDIVEGSVDLLRTKIEEDLDWLENQLEKQAGKKTSAGSEEECYLVGNHFTAADLMVGASLDLIRRYQAARKELQVRVQQNGHEPKRVRLDQWLEMLGKRPAFIRASEKCR